MTWHLDAAALGFTSYVGWMLATLVLSFAVMVIGGSFFLVVAGHVFCLLWGPWNGPRAER